jgi:hypothetical protein
MDAQTILTAIQTHWDTITMVAGVVFGGGILTALKDKAYRTAGLMALELVRKVAVMELAPLEKRKWVVDTIFENLPLWAKGFVTKGAVTDLVERTYQLLRGELGVAPSTLPPSVDPTVPVVDADNMEVKTPIKIDPQ